MTPFPLTIVTPDGMVYEGQVEEVVVRTTTGDLGIQAGHIPCVAPLGMGTATVLENGQKRYAACIGGMIAVMDGKVKIVATTFEWAEEIDVGRAESSAQRAQEVIADKTASSADVELAQARLKRALIRRSAATHK